MPKGSSTTRKSATRPRGGSKTKQAHPSADRPYAPGYGIVGPEKGDGLLPWSWVAGKMTRCRTFWLATIHAAHARPHVMPLWGVWVDEAFFFSTGRKSRKGQNLAANPACTVMNDDGEEAAIVEGQAREVKDPKTLARVASAYKKKYKIDPRGIGEPIYEVRPAKVFAPVITAL